MMTIFKNDGRWDTSNVEMDRGRIRLYSVQRNERMTHIDYGLGILTKTFSSLSHKLLLIWLESMSNYHSKESWLVIRLKGVFTRSVPQLDCWNLAKI